MKIGIVLSQTPRYSETFFVSKIRGLQLSGFTPILFVQEKHHKFSLCEVKTVISLSDYHSLFRFIKLTITVISVFFKAPKRLYNFFVLEKKANRPTVQILKNVYNNSHLLKSDLDWIHFGFATMAIQSENVSKTINAKMAVSFRGYDIDDYPLKHPNCYNLLWKKVDKIHSISRYLLNKAYTLGMLEQTPFKIITPAINVEDIYNNKNTFNDNDFLTIARLHPIKGLDYTLKALAILKAKNQLFSYNIIGEGSESKYLKELIRELGLENCVTLLGKKSHEETINRLDKSALYIQYSNSEGFCNAVLEAQSKGLLCVVSNGGALPENVIDNKTGWVVPKKNPEALAETILKIIDLPEQEKKAVSLNAQKRVKTNFNLDSQREQFKLFYEDN